MTREDLKREQEIMTEMLFDVADVCERNNIQYFLMYGTLLGAVRHHGPIPWDEDVDIAMTRENYLKFLEIAPKELDERNEIHVMGQSQYLSEIKIGRKGTLTCMPGAENLDIMKQTHLDIFMLDRLKTHGGTANKILRAVSRFLRICKQPWDEKRLIILVINKGNRRFKGFYKAGIYVMHGLRAILGGEKRIEKMIYKMYVDESNTSDKLGAVALGYGETILADCGEDRLMYDGRMLSVPANYEEILKNTYGDYMQFPPEEERYNKYFDEWIFVEEKQ